jgi:hypothetical protein
MSPELEQSELARLRALVDDQAALLREFRERLRVFEDREHLVQRVIDAANDPRWGQEPNWERVIVLTASDLARWER